MKAQFTVKSSVAGTRGSKVLLTPISGDFTTGRPDGLLMLGLAQGQALNPGATVTIEVTAN